MAKSPEEQAAVLLALGKRQQAQGDARAAVEMLRAEVVRTGPADLHNVLQWAMTALNEVL